MVLDKKKARRKQEDMIAITGEPQLVQANCMLHLVVVVLSSRVSSTNCTFWNAVLKHNTNITLSYKKEGTKLNKNTLDYSVPF